jgi:hypothetical protein
MKGLCDIIRKHATGPIQRALLIDGSRNGSYAKRLRNTPSQRSLYGTLSVLRLNSETKVKHSSRHAKISWSFGSDFATIDTGSAVLVQLQSTHDFSTSKTNSQNNNTETTILKMS